MFKILWVRPRTAQEVPELNQFPSTPQGYYSGYYPGSKGVENGRVTVKFRNQVVPEHNFYPQTPAQNPYPAWLEPQSNTFSFNLKRQEVLELNVYPATPAPATLPAYLDPPKFKINFRRTHLTPEEINTYPQTPAAYYEGYYPGSGGVKANRIRFRNNIQSVPEHNFYPTLTSAAVYPSYLDPPVFKTRGWRKLRTVLELDRYPGLLPTVGVNSLLSDRGVGVDSLLSSAASGVNSLIDPSTGVNSILSDRGIGVSSGIDETGKGVS